MQTWHHVLRKPQSHLNEIKHLHERSPFYCSSRVHSLQRPSSVLRRRTSSRLGRGGRRLRLDLLEQRLQSCIVSVECRESTKKIELTPCVTALLCNIKCSDEHP